MNITTARRLNRPLLALTVLMALTAIASITLAIVAPVEILGVNGWIKPLKFSISIAIFAFTIALVINLYPKRRWISVVAAVMSALLLIEQVLIVAAVVQGTTSHFNATTTMSSVIYSVMGVSIGVVWILTLALGVLVWRRPVGPPDQVSALRFGMVIGLIGMALAFLMTSPTAAQLSNFEGIAGAHAVGLADGGPGIPFLGWSTVGGDLRIPHFVGMHALQALPILAFALMLLARRVPQLSDVLVRRSLIRIAAVTFVGVLAIITWQALIGESIVHPSLPIIAAASALAIGAALSVIMVVARARVAQPVTSQAEREVVTVA